MNNNSRSRIPIAFDADHVLSIGPHSVLGPEESCELQVWRVVNEIGKVAHLAVNRSGIRDHTHAQPAQALKPFCDKHV
jgi:hypothetical protein